MRRAVACKRAVLFLGCVGLTTQPAFAACVVPMSMTELADGAGQVIVGTVTSIRSYWTASPRTIESEITLDQVEYLKGQPIAPAANTFVLRVPGGTVGDTTLQLCSAPSMSIGQTWLLFLQPTYKTYPVVGLSQGAFQLVTQSSGTKQVLAAGGAAVLGLDKVGYVRMAHAGGLAMDRLRAVHRVRMVNVKPALASHPIDWPSFRTLIEPILATSTNYHLTAPAGQPDPAVLFRPTALCASPNNSAGPVKTTDETSTLLPATVAGSARATHTGRRMATDQKVVPRRDMTSRPSTRKAPR